MSIETDEKPETAVSAGTDCYPHDVFEDMESRLSPNQHRSPRVLVVDECRDGQLSFGELANDGTTGDTTLVGSVLNPVKAAIRRGQLAGTVTVDGIVYAFVFGRFCG